MNAKEKHEVFWACFFRSFYDEEDVDIRLEHVGLDLDDTYGTSMRITWAVGLLAAGALPCLQQSYHHCALCNVWLLQELKLLFIHGICILACWVNQHCSQQHHLRHALLIYHGFITKKPHI